MNFGDKLRQYRIEHHLDQKELAKIIGVSKQTISAYESRGNRPTYNDFVEMCNTLKVDAHYFMDDELKYSDNKLSQHEYDILHSYKKLSDSDRRIVDFILSINKPSTIIDNIIYLPLLEQRASAGIGKETGDISNNVDDIRAFPASNAIKTASHAIIIDGNSMQPEIIDGQIVFIDAKQECNDGDYGIFNVVVNGESTIYCKQYKFDKSGKPYLHSVNANVGDPEFSESDEVQIQCIGKIIKW